MPDGVMANISHFDCDVPGSLPVRSGGEILVWQQLKRIAAYSLMEEYCATNTEIKVRLFLSRLNNLEVTVFFNLVRNSIGRVPVF